MARARVIEGARGRSEIMEEKLAQIIAEYWTAVKALAGNEAKIAERRAEAVAAIKRLGYTEGDALRWLRPKGWRG